MTTTTDSDWSALRRMAAQSSDTQRASIVAILRAADSATHNNRCASQNDQRQRDAYLMKLWDTIRAIENISA